MSDTNSAVFGRQVDPARDHKVVVAIDFGTSGSGYAYAFTKPGKRLNPTGDVFAQKPWPMTDGGKTSTAILLRKVANAWKIVSIGKEAVIDVSKLRNHERQQHFFARSFKMKLYEPFNGPENLMIKDDQTGFTIRATDLIGFFLRKVKEAALKQIIGATSSTIYETDILWVVTVPAIWPEPAKWIMRKGAELGGIIAPGREASLMLVLEPEAASMWCLANRATSFSAGETVIVADCGGGTIDVTVHKVTNDNETTMKEAIPSAGGAWGSTVVDRAYFKLIGDLVGTETVSEFAKKHPSDWIDFVDNWERAKCSFDGHRSSPVKPPPEIAKILAENLKDYNELFGTDFDFEDGRLYIEPEDMANLFDAAVKSTVDHVRATLKRAPQAKAVLLVGNFANSFVLQDAFRKAFEPTRRVIVPSQPGDCVLKGAVLFGNSPECIAERVSKTGQDLIRVQVFEGQEPGMTYIPDSTKSAKNLGGFNSERFDPTILKERGVKVSMLFGFSELLVKAELPNGHITSNSFTYQ
ncbi:hypothetical protein DFJ73DRAFT_760133 [Zopfochytrium polystomum]|nr:hypothetical protein DFJ73DRAFT_760133 [Zopfochytrium polystomum]